jgi:hypothetical protein
MRPAMPAAMLKGSTTRSGVCAGAVMSDVVLETGESFEVGYR